MTKFLINKFIKNSQDVENDAVREKYGTLASVVGIISNIFLFITKLLVGLVSGSVSIMADSFNNLSDSASSIISLLSFKISSKPPDKEHPFGHGRAEYISSLIVSFIIMLLGYEFFKSSIDKILNPNNLNFDITSIIILIIGVLIKIWQSGFNKLIGKKINSSILIATSVDSRNDVIITSITILSTVFTKVTNIYIDGYVGIVVAGFLLFSGYQIAKDMLSQLLGESGSPELGKILKQEILKFDGVLGVHDLIVHNYGPTKTMATIHVEVCDKENIQDSHELIDKIEKEIAKKLQILLVIHMDPINTSDKRIKDLKEIIDKKLQANYENKYKDCSAHEFRIVDGNDAVNFIFELEVPHHLSNKECEELVKLLQKEIKKVNPNFNSIINIETGYI